MPVGALTFLAQERMGSHPMPTLGFRILLLACLASTVACSGGSLHSGSGAASKTTGMDTFKVGLTTLSFEDAARHRPLPTHVWYPADQGAEERDVALDGIFLGHAAMDAPLASAPQRFPLVLLSHGSGGGGSTLVWFAESLARHGYLAAAVDHFGNTFRNNSPEGVIAVWRRPGDLVRVLDALLTDKRFGARVAVERIGAAGFSSGGYTVMALAGAIYRLDLMVEHCRGNPRARDCELAANSDASQIADRDAASQSYRDPRIRAVFAMAPAVGQGFDAAGLAPVRVPVQIVAGVNDEQVPFAMNAQHYASLIAGSRLTALDSGGHFVFMPLCNGMGLQVAREVCTDIKPSVDRKGIHERVSQLAVAFFGEQLR
jgi:predicted dienelactone hydrolase